MEKTTLDFEQQKRILKEAEEFLEKLGVTETIKTVLESEDCKEIIRSEYETLGSIVMELKKNVPEELKDIAEYLYSEGFLGQLDKFEADVVANIKIRIHLSFDVLPESIKKACKDTLTSYLSSDEGKESILKDVKATSNGVREKLQKSYLNFVYKDWIPKGIPAEVAEFIKMIGGGDVLIPATAIFPGLGSEDTSSDDAETDTAVEDECDSDGEVETDSEVKDECDSDGDGEIDSADEEECDSDGEVETDSADEEECDSDGDGENNSADDAETDSVDEEECDSADDIDTDSETEA